MHGCIDRAEQVRDPIAGSAVVCPDDYPVGREEIVHRVTLPQKLGIADHVDTGVGHHLGESGGSADRGGGFVHQNRPGLQYRHQSSGYAVDHAHVGDAGGTHRRGHADEDDVPLGKCADLRTEFEPAERNLLSHKIGEAGLGKCHLTPTQVGDLGFVDVDRVHVVSEAGQPGRCGETDVSDANDTDRHRYVRPLAHIVPAAVVLRAHGSPPAMVPSGRVAPLRQRSPDRR